MPTIVAAGIDRDGRGGRLGGSDIDATGLRLTTSSGMFDATAFHSGQGRGDVGGALNDWTPVRFSRTSAVWAQAA